MLPLEPSASLVYGAYLSLKVKGLGPHVLTQTQQARAQVSTASLYVTIREAVASRAFSGSRKQDYRMLSVGDGARIVVSDVFVAIW